MAQDIPQNFENHTRIVPAYHIVAFGILILNLGRSLYKMVRYFSADTVFAFLMAVAILIIFFYARTFAMTVQDRIIRLEMRLRLEKLLPANLQTRISEFTVGQLASLRFASDAELPELARKVLAERITDRKTIKKMIQTWVPDILRA